MLLKNEYGYTGEKELTRVAAGADETRFTALSASEDAGYWVSWTLNAPIEDTYILAPACAYNGNRFEAVERRYPPMFIESELEKNPPIRMTQVPRLEKTGDSFMDVTSGDLSAPCVCVLNKREKQAFMLFFNQGDHGLNHGLTLEQEGDLLHVTLRAPAKRRLVYRMCRLYEDPTADAKLKVEKGDETVISHRVFTVPCESVTDLYREFFEKRAVLYSAGSYACLPFSAYWDLIEKHYNEHHFSEAGGYYTNCNTDKASASRFGEWQAGWAGGGMLTLPLLTDGGELSKQHAVQALEKITEWQSAIGFYYGIMYRGKPEYDCFNYYDEKYKLLLIRKHVDLVYFMFRQIAAMEKMGMAVPASVRRSAVMGADAIVRLFRENGQLGQFVNVETGEIIVGGSASGGIAAAALCAAYAVTGDEKYAGCARDIGRYLYKTTTGIGVTTGGPGEILQAPDSESAVGLTESFVALYEMDGTDEWLNMACDAAHQLASWIVPYDYEFPPESRFAKRGVHAAGSVWASVQNKHSAPGLCTASTAMLLKLYRATGNENYLRLMREVSHFLPQVASTPENPMELMQGGALLPGEMCERVNMSDWEGRKNVGDSISGSSVWPEANTMLTCGEVPGVYAVPSRGIVCVADHVNAHLDGSDLVIENPTAYPARVKVMADDEVSMKEKMGLYWLNRFRIAEVPAGGSVRMAL